MPYRVGVAGYGYIGREVVSRLRADKDSFEVAFVHCRRREQADDVPDAEFLSDMAETGGRGADLVVEAAHPEYTALYGSEILARSDYLPLSTTALADDHLRRRLIRTAFENGTRLLLAAGALIGGEEMLKRTAPWTRARIVFRKHPENIDFSDVPIKPEDVCGPTVAFEGSAREIAARFPRNVNTMVTAALLTTGLDDCEAALVADPSLDCAVAEVEAWAADGGYIRTEKRQPASGVSGSEMADSVWFSIRRAAGAPGEALHLV